MQTKIVTRHKGAVEWLRKYHPEFKDAELCPHVKASELVGYRIVGVLPIPLAIMSSEYWHLNMYVPKSKRGEELSCEEMEKYGCQITQYRIEVVPKEE